MQVSVRNDSSAQKAWREREGWQGPALGPWWDPGATPQLGTKEKSSGSSEVFIKLWVLE